MGFLKKYGWALLLAAVFSMAFFWPGCSGGGNSGGPSDGDSVITVKSALVCADGEAWIMAEIEEGYIFRPNGDVIAVEARGNGGWYGKKVGTYSADGDNLTIVIDGEEDTLTYSVSANELTLTGEGGATEAYAKRTGVYVNA